MHRIFNAPLHANRCIFTHTVCVLHCGCVGTRDSLQLISAHCLACCLVCTKWSHIWAVLVRAIGRTRNLPAGNLAYNQLF